MITFRGDYVPIQYWENKCYSAFLMQIVPVCNQTVDDRKFFIVKIFQNVTIWQLLMN